MEVHSAEVKGMLLKEYNEIETMELFKEEGRAEGREEGLQEGLTKGLQEGLTKGLQEGLTKGQILQAIKMYRNWVHYNDEQILAAIQTEFSLSPEEAEYYLVMERLSH